jgi:hemoglobin-like flavoprotein
MTPEELAAVEQSLEGLRYRLDEVSDAFYLRLFATHPELERLFPDDLPSQRAKFAAQLDDLVSSIRNLDVLFRAGAQLGARHLGYGVESRHYELALEPLIASLAAHSGDSWNGGIAAAWRRAYQLVAEVMLQGAAAARTARVPVGEGPEPPRRGWSQASRLRVPRVGDGAGDVDAQ